MDLIQIPTTFGRGFIILCSLEMCPTIGTKPLPPASDTSTTAFHSFLGQFCNPF